MAQPNFLILMVDQLAGTFFPDGPADWLHMPNLKALAKRSTRFPPTCTCTATPAPERWNGYGPANQPTAPFCWCAGCTGRTTDAEPRFSLRSPG